MKNVIEPVKTWFYTNPTTIRLCCLLGGIALSSSTFADGDIPTPDPSDDPTSGNNDFLDILVNIVKTKAGPLLIYGGAIFFIFLAIFDIYRGYKKYQDTEDFGKFKMSLVVGAILVVVGLSLLFLGQYILTKWAGG